MAIVLGDGINNGFGWLPVAGGYGGMVNMRRIAPLPRQSIYKYLILIHAAIDKSLWYVCSTTLNIGVDATVPSA